MESHTRRRSTQHAVLVAVLTTSLLATAPIDRCAALSAQSLPNEGWGPAEASAEGLLAAYRAADPERVAEFFAEDAMILTSEGPVPAEMILDALRYHFQNLTGQRCHSEHVCPFWASVSRHISMIAFTIEHSAE